MPFGRRSGYFYVVNTNTPRLKHSDRRHDRRARLQQKLLKKKQLQVQLRVLKDLQQYGESTFTFEIPVGKQHIANFSHKLTHPKTKPSDGSAPGWRPADLKLVSTLINGAVAFAKTQHLPQMVAHAASS